MEPSFWLSLMGLVVTVEAGAIVFFFAQLGEAHARINRVQGALDAYKTHVAESFATQRHLDALREDVKQPIQSLTEELRALVRELRSSRQWRPEEK